MFAHVHRAPVRHGAGAVYRLLLFWIKKTKTTQHFGSRVSEEEKRFRFRKRDSLGVPCDLRLGVVFVRREREREIVVCQVAPWL